MPIDSDWVRHFIVTHPIAEKNCENAMKTNC